MIGGHNHTALAGGGNESDNVATLAPDIPAERLQVRDVHGQAGFFSNPDSFACGAEKTDVVGAFVTQVRVVDAVVASRHSRERNDFLGVGIVARPVKETG